MSQSVNKLPKTGLRRKPNVQLLRVPSLQRKIRRPNRRERRPASQRAVADHHYELWPGELLFDLYSRCVWTLLT